MMMMMMMTIFINVIIQFNLLGQRTNGQLQNRH